MRILAACSLGGAGHLYPLLPFLAAARRRGDEILVVGPPSMREMVERAGYAFEPGGEPPESEVAPIRERLPIAPPAEASMLGNRELFGRLATTAMLPPMERICAEWCPNLVLRDPCEYASAVVAGRLGHMTLAADVYRVALDALRDVDARVLLTVGRAFDLAELGPVPGNVHVEPWIDQARVFSESALVVCHGGSGTVFGALAAGVPVVVVPVFADQFDNGRRVARTGAGLVVETAEEDVNGGRSVITATEAPRTTNAIDEALRDESYRRAARAIANDMAAAPTVDEVLTKRFGATWSPPVGT